MLQVCDCSKLAETCVPCTEKDSVSPLFACMMLFCRPVSSVTVAFICANGTLNEKDHWMVGVGCGLSGLTGRMPVGIVKVLLTPEKLAIVIPDPFKAASTSSRLALMGVVTETPNNT